MATTAANLANRVCKLPFVATGAGTNCPSTASGSDGGRCRARTYDPLIKSQLLYQLS